MHRRLIVGLAPILISQATYAQAKMDSLGKESVRLSEVVVDSKYKARYNHSISQKLQTAILNKQVGQSLAEVLERISGVSSIQTGVAQSKPVIHGMHGNRILIVNNGARQTGQQWSEGHAPEIDVSSSGEVYVLKGAESVRYGSEALGGVIVLEQSPLLYSSRDTISGKVNLQYASNGRRVSENMLLNFSFKDLKNFAFRLQASAANNGDYSTAHYLLNNTGGREYAGLFALGYQLSGLRLEGYLSHYYEHQGIMLNSNLGNEHRLLEIIENGQPLEFTPFTRHIGYPKETVRHTNLSFKAEYSFQKAGLLKYQFTYQDDHRQEFRIRRNNNSHIPEMDLKLQSAQHLLRWERRYGSWQTEIGGLYQQINNYSVPGNGIVPVIPNYAESSWGVYGIQKYDALSWGIEAGLRLDGQSTEANGYDLVGEPYGGRRQFRNLSYNLGGRYHIGSGLMLKSNFGVAWRAPHVHELYSNGGDHGSAAFIRGDDSLESEQSYKWVSSLSYRLPWLSLRLDAYLQWVHNYIYDEPQMRSRGVPQVMTLISGTYPLFQFKQTNAFFRGVDLELGLKPCRWLSYELRTALIYANELSTGNYLPYIPPVRVDHGIKISLPRWFKHNEISLRLEHRYVAKQTRFDPNKDLIPYTPDAYHLLGVELAWTYQDQITLRLSGDNLLNASYKEYTNRARYYSHDLGRNLKATLSVAF